MQEIVVGANGQRIANEDLYGAAFTEALIHRADGKGYLIVDSVTWEKAKSSIDKDVVASLKLLIKWLFAFGHKNANTLELASKLGISASELTRITDVYNERVMSGIGDPYRKNTARSSLRDHLGKFCAWEYNLQQDD